MRLTTMAAAALLAAGISLSPRCATASDWPQLVSRPITGRIGVGVQPMTPELREFFAAPPDQGVLVARVVEDSPAAQVDIRVGDVLLAVDGHPLDGPFDLLHAVTAGMQDDALEIRVLRQTVTLTKSVTPQGPEHPWSEPRFWNDLARDGARIGADHLEQFLGQLENQLDRGLEDLDRGLRDLQDSLEDRRSPDAPLADEKHLT